MFTPQPSKLRSTPLPAKRSTPAFGTPLLRRREAAGQVQGEIYAKDGRRQISSLGVLSPRVQELLAALPRESYYGVVDIESGYGCIVTEAECFVWALVEGPAALWLVFPCPKAQSLFKPTKAPLPVVTFTKGAVFSGSQGQKDVGLFIVSSNGECRYWDSVVYGLVSVQKYKSVQAYLGEEDQAWTLTPCEPVGTLLTTRKGNLFKITTGSTTSALKATPLIKPVGVLSRVSSLFAGSDLADQPDSLFGATAVVSSIVPARNSRDIVALTPHSIQRWTVVSGAGTDKMTLECDVAPLIHKALKEAKLVDFDIDAQPVVYDLALAYLNEEYCCLLAGYCKDQATHFALVKCSIDKDIRVVECQQIYTSTSGDFGRGKPRLVAAGPSAVAIFPRAFVIVTLDSFFTETVPLKNSNDYIVGSGSLKTDTFKVWFICRQSGVLQLQVNLQVQQATTPIKQATLKAQLEQAVLFGAREHNPIQFDLKNTSSDGEQLSQAALQVSAEIVKGTSEYVDDQVLDTGVHLHRRYSAAGSIMRFIKDQGLSALVSDLIKCQLRTHAGYLAVAEALWVCHSEQAAKAMVYPAASRLLPTSVQQCLAGQAMHEENADVRYFVRHYPFLVAELPRFLAKVAIELMQESENESEKHAILGEMNRVVLRMLDAVTSYEDQTQQLYAIQKLGRAEPWNCSQPLIGLLTSNFEQTLQGYRLLPSTNTSGQPATLHSKRQRVELATPVNVSKTPALAAQLGDQLGDQLDQLAQHALRAFCHRLDYLEDNSDSMDQEYKLLQERYETVRPLLIRPLTEVNPMRAIDLAEQFEDFGTLADLICSCEPGVDVQNQLSYYMKQYRPEFCYALYDWYVQHQCWPLLLEGDREYDAVLLAYLQARQDQPQFQHLQGLHLLRMAQYADASQQLQAYAASEPFLPHKKIALSLAKLSQAVTTAADTEHAMALEEAIDIADVQNSVYEYFVQVVSERLPLLPKDESKVVSVIVEHCSSMLAKASPHLGRLFSALVGRVWKQQVLSTEDLVDILTLKNNQAAEQKDDFYVALGVVQCAASSVLPVVVERIVKSIWRRLVIHLHNKNWSSLHALQNQMDDQAIASTLRSNVLYRTLYCAVQDNVPAQWILSPGECFFQATADQLQLRAFSATSVEDLLQGGQLENQWLDQAIKQCNVHSYYTEMVRMVQEEIQNEDLMEE